MHVHTLPTNHLAIPYHPIINSSHLPLLSSTATAQQLSISWMDPFYPTYITPFILHTNDQSTR